MGMSLPFLRNRRIQSILVGRKKEGEAMELPESEHPLASAADDLLKAIESKDVNSIANALQAAFQISEAMPHDEGENE
jgi:hypothetical protein